MRITAYFFMMLIMDYCVIASARKLLLDFLRGGTSRKNFQKVCQSQSFRQKASLAYVKEYIREPSFHRPFRIYSTAYYIYTALIPCEYGWWVLTAVQAVSLEWSFIVHAVYSLLWFAFFSFEAPGKRHSRYAGRKYRKVR